MKTYIYTSTITSSTNTRGEYDMGEISICEYGEEWNGDVTGYIENLLADADMLDDSEIHDEGMLGNVRQNFGGVDPIDGSIRVIFYKGEPSAVYWASSVKADWADNDD